MATTAGTDSIGTSVAFVLGGIVGLSLAVPAVPGELTPSSLAFGPTETVLLLGAVAILSLPPVFVVLSSLIQPGS